MAINIIDIYLKNQPGSLLELTSYFLRERIEIYCIANSGEEDYIPVSLVVSHTEKAVHDLGKLGYELDVEEGIACEVSNHPGGINSVAKVLAEAGVNIITIFSAPSKNHGFAVLILRVNDTDLAESILKKNWIKMIDIDDLIV